VHLHRRWAGEKLSGAGPDGAWFDDYVESKKKTLLVLNIGAHIHKTKTFIQAWDEFLSAFETKLAENKTGDKIVFRLTPPGHNNCHKFQKPFASLDQFETSCSSQQFDWNSFEEYNNHVRESLSKKGLADRVLVLDVVPMTKLRPDGHMEFDGPNGRPVVPKADLTEDEISLDSLPGIDHNFPRFGKKPKHKHKQTLDCLHYKLPGVPDYWNHMLLNEVGTTNKEFHDHWKGEDNLQ